MANPVATLLRRCQESAAADKSGDPNRPDSFRVVPHGNRIANTRLARPAARPVWLQTG